jgi:hypothetical protein
VFSDTPLAQWGWPEPKGWLSHNHPQGAKRVAETSSRFIGTKVILVVKSLQKKKKSISNSSSPKILLLHLLSKTLIVQSERRTGQKLGKTLGLNCVEAFFSFLFSYK